jgi:type IV secretory pathway VirB10-like protein
LVVAGVSNWQDRKEKARQSELQARETAAKAEEEKRKEDKFRNMSAAEHLDHVKSLLTINSAPDSLSEALKHIAAIPPHTPEASAAAGIKRQYEVAKRRQAEEAARAQAIAEKRKAMQDAAAAKKRVIEGDDKRRQALALAFEEVMRQQGHEVSVSATSDQLWFDCSSALEPRSSCYTAYQSSKHLPSDLKAELRAVGITTLNFSPNGGMIPTWANNVK